MNPLDRHPTDRILELVRRLYEVVSELERAFPGRKFTPDGHLVGSIGEVLAARRYGLTLLPASSEGYDAICPRGTRVEIKATQGKSIALRSEPEHLMVLLLKSSGNAVEVFNGPGAVAWQVCGPVQKNGQRQVSTSRLHRLMAGIPGTQRLSEVE
ncbi:DUF6998 domain-containing protein [Rubrivivax albus]|uniref:DUF6998 domain-containing protein n=1 Tax=Rubrivivax albus TaxID=2499835 RepID=A0A3S2TXV7_9BURK|nr:hypothetical protein [Rubrivivax albus]RVT46830.1 hypothetical protein ENE75_24540 [Rubrivivax albus]